MQNLPGRKLKDINRKFDAKGLIMLKFMAPTFPHPFSHLFSNLAFSGKATFTANKSHEMVVREGGLWPQWLAFV